MPKLNGRLPAYRRHKNSGQAIVTLNGRDHYLGPWNTKASRGEYDRLIGEWMASGRQLSPAVQGADLSIAELVNVFRLHVADYYRHPDGTPTKEVACFQYALKLIREVYGPTSASQFGPLALRALQTKMVETGWSRGYTNQQTQRIRMMFKWAVSRELVAPSVHHALQTVTGLKFGRTTAREPEPIKPVPDAIVDACLPHMPPTLRAMVELQRVTGMRPMEVCGLRPADLDIDGDSWTYRPRRHKMEYRGRERLVLIGPRGQYILQPLLTPDVQAPVFSPAKVQAERLATRRENRTTPMNEGNTPGSNRVRRPKRRPGNVYTTAAYDGAIKAACRAAFPAPRSEGKRPGETDDQCRDRQHAERLAWEREHSWSPNQLRHSFATKVRKQAGLEAAQVLLEHAREDVTQVYAERDLSKAVEVIALVG